MRVNDKKGCVVCYSKSDIAIFLESLTGEGNHGSLFVHDITTMYPNFVFIHPLL